MGTKHSSENIKDLYEKKVSNDKIQNERKNKSLIEKYKNNLNKNKSKTIRYIKDKCKNLIKEGESYYIFRLCSSDNKKLYLDQQFLYMRGCIPEGYSDQFSIGNYFLGLNYTDFIQTLKNEFDNSVKFYDPRILSWKQSPLNEEQISQYEKSLVCYPNKGLLIIIDFKN